MSTAPFAQRRIKQAKTVQMDLAFNEEQVMLRDMMRRLCDEEASLELLRQHEGTERGYPKAFWNSVVELGVAGVVIDAEFGGMGLGALDALVIHEELGRGLAFSPHAISSLSAAEFIARAGTPEQRARWLPQIAGGERIVTVASLEPASGYGREGVVCAAARRGDTFALSGAKAFVPYLSSADAVIVLAKAGDSVCAFLIDTRASGLSMSYQPNMAREPLFVCALEGVSATAADVLSAGQDVWSAWEETSYLPMMAAAAQAVGGADRVLALTVEYAKQRHAFGRPIGGFQAIAHMLADAAVEVEGARTLVRQAAWARDAGKPFRQLAVMSKLQACEMFRRVSAVAIQVHGGLGYTNAADPQLFYRRAKQLELLGGDGAYLEQRLAGFALGELEDAPRHV